MIIVSQDKTKIINFDNICNINTNKEEIVVYYNIGNIQVGKYKTEERAKEVLQEIVKKYSLYLELKGGPAILQGQTDIQPNIFNIPKVYEIPEE